MVFWIFHAVSYAMPMKEVILSGKEASMAGTWAKTAAKIQAVHPDVAFYESAMKKLYEISKEEINKFIEYLNLFEWKDWATKKVFEPRDFY